LTTLGTLVVLLAISVSAGAEPPAPGVADARLYDRIDRMRVRRGLPALERRADLERVAVHRASRAADAPPARRLPLSPALGEELEDEQELAGRPVAERLELLIHVADERAVADALWADPSVDSPSLDTRSVAVGLATRRAADGTLVLVALFLQDDSGPLDLEELERRTEIEINGVRREHGLVMLEEHAALREVARGHSRDMAERGYFAHESPEGHDHVDRARQAAVAYRLIGENIGQVRLIHDPVFVVVDGWMNSPEHRDNILGNAYRRTAVGVAVAEDGTVYFTQLFLME
jgi:uncharacterized protein YkwD